jgi:hypothetical protein
MKHVCIRPRRLALLLLGVTASVTAVAGSPDCGGPNGWAARIALARLQNAGLILMESDFPTTKVVRLASEKIGKDLYRQIHKVTFANNSGATIEVISMNDASHVECSMSGVEVFVVSHDLGNLNE